jgi:hypothetical protein
MLLLVSARQRMWWCFFYKMTTYTKTKDDVSSGQIRQTHAEVFMLKLNPAQVSALAADMLLVLKC